MKDEPPEEKKCGWNLLCWIGKGIEWLGNQVKSWFEPKAPAPTPDVSALQTQAVQTVVASITQTAQVMLTRTPTATDTSTMTPSPTQIPSPTPTTFQSLPGGYSQYSPYWYGKTYFDILQNTDGWWHRYQGQPFGMKTYIAIVYNYEIAVFANDPLVREYLTEAFARRYWQAQIDYGPDGAFWYLGGREMVIRRVLANAPLVNEGDYNISQSFEEAQRILSETEWRQGISWNRPYDWGNPDPRTIDNIAAKVPDFLQALQERRMGTSDYEILYLSPSSITLKLANGQYVTLPQFFIVTKGQSV
ncbi:MAG: hypothetical protein ACK8QZ_12010, partial [Anaerolineales bacterium]